MKAKEWVATLKDVAPNSEDFKKIWEEFKLETAKLIADRTKGSGVVQIKKSLINTKNGAIDGAVREQRQKWLAVCRKLPALNPNEFDAMMEKDWAEAVAKYNGKQEDKSLVSNNVTDEVGEVLPGRELAARAQV